jgi:hypothetical protein
VRVRTTISTVVACAWLLTAPAAASQSTTTKPSAGPAEPAAALKQDMRKLWTDHVVWTRDYIIAALADAPDAPSALTRLLKSQDDIGGAVAKFYGNAAGTQLTALLKDHIAIAGDLVKAAKAGDKAAQQQADTKWRQNAMQIADFLSKANPNWPRATLVDMMNKHLSTTTDEVVARLGKKWDDDVRAFDAVYDHILHMSDTLADGIVKQFPEKFGAVSTTGKR